LPPEKQKNPVLLRALKISTGTLSSRILGLIREMALAAFFDRTVTDAWTAAFRLPNLFRRLLGEGALAMSLQPLLIEAQMHDEKTGGERASALRSAMHGFLVVTLSVLSIAGILFASPVLKWVLSSHYTAQAEAFELTVRMARVMFGFLFFICLYAYYSSILNAVGSFGWSAAAPVMFNVSLIISTFLPSSWLSVPGDLLAWGVLVGGFLQMGVLIYPLRKLGVFPGFRSPFGNLDLLHVLKNMIPGLLGLGVMQLTSVINTHFASQLGAGSISYIYWADRLLELPLSLISVSLGTALLPTLAELWLRDEKKVLSEVSERYLSLGFFIAAMGAVGLFSLSEPIVRLLFERGQFGESDVLAVGSVLKIYALTLIPVSGVRILAPSYYAVKKNGWPAVCAIVSVVVHVLIAPSLMERFGLQGLNLSSFFSAGLNMFLLLSFYGSHISEFPWRVFGLKSSKTLVASLVMVGVCFFILKHFGAEPKSKWQNLLELLVGGSAGVLSYILTSIALKHPDVHMAALRVKTLFLSRFQVGKDSFF
jgi:putative peptidoglycan lipid II flippase